MNLVVIAIPIPKGLNVYGKKSDDKFNDPYRVVCWPIETDVCLVY